MSRLVLRPADPRDLDILTEWQTRPHVIAAGVGEDWQWQTELRRRPAWREQLIAELDARPIGFVQIIDPALEDSHYWGNIGPGLRAIDIWIGEADCLGQGYGGEMMRQALDRCFRDNNVGAVLVDPIASNTRARAFYRRFGFELLEARRFGDDDCLVFRLQRKKWLHLDHAQNL